MELINTDNQLVSTRDPNWGLITNSSTDIAANNGMLTIGESTLRSTRGNLLVWSWYWVDGKYTSNGYLAKLYQAKAKLLGDADDAAAIFVYTPYDGKPDRAMATLREFVRPAFRSLDLALSQAKR